MGQDVRPTRSPALLSLAVLVAYVALATLFFWPALLPGHTLSGSDYLWNVAPWAHLAPSGVPVNALHPRVLGANPQLIDAVTVFQPYLQYTASQLPHLPLWNPYIMGGAPYLADMQSAIFSPFSLPAYVLPFWWSLGVIAVMKVVVAAFGTYLLARVLSMARPSAFLAGLIYGFGLFMVAWIPWPLTAVFALIPWMLLATEWVIRRPSARSLSALAIVVALQFFGGHPETSVTAIFVTLGYFALRLLGQPGGVLATLRDTGGSTRDRLGACWGHVWRPSLVFALGMAGGLALCAITMLPFLELLTSSSDLSSRPRSGVHVQSDYVFAAFLPKYFPGGFVITTAFYAGALSLMLAVIAMLRRSAVRVTVAIVGVLTLLVVLGIQPFFAIAGHIPILDLTYLSRLGIVWLLCIALLAGWGLDDLAARRLSAHQRVVSLVSAGVIFVTPIVIVLVTGGASSAFFSRAAHIAWLFGSEPIVGSPQAEALFRTSSLLVWVTVAGAGVLVIALGTRTRITTRVLTMITIVVIAGDLFFAGMGYNPAIPTSHAVQPVTPAIRYLQAQRPARYVAVTPYGGFNPLPPDVNVRYRLYDLRGYDLPVVAQFGTMWTRYIAPVTPLLPLDTPSVPLSVVTNSLTPQAMRLFSLFGVRDLLEEPNGPLVSAPGIHVVYQGKDARIYANSNVLPRSWLVGSDEVIPSSRAALNRVVDPSFDPATTVVTATKLANLSTAPTSAPGSSTITSYGAERVAITARSSRPAELVLSDTAYPGWQATVNGRQVAISRVDDLIRGVAVPAGVSKVVFTYEPKSYSAGRLITLATVLVLAAASAISWWRDRSRSPRRGRHAAAR